jgi:hypothetical protein
VDPDPGVTLDGGDHLGGSPPQFLTEALTVFARHEHFQPEVRDEDQGARKQQKIIYRVKHRPTIMPFAGPVKRTGIGPQASGIGKNVNATDANALLTTYDTGHPAHGVYGD